MLGVDVGGVEIAARAVDELVPETVPSDDHRHVVETEPPPHDRMRHGGRGLQCLVDDRLHRHDVAAA